MTQILRTASKPYEVDTACHAIFQLVGQKGKKEKRRALHICSSPPPAAVLSISHKSVIKIHANTGQEKLKKRKDIKMRAMVKRNEKEEKKRRFQQGDGNEVAFSINSGLNSGLAAAAASTSPHPSPVLLSPFVPFLLSHQLFLSSIQWLINTSMNKIHHSRQVHSLLSSHIHTAGVIFVLVTQNIKMKHQCCAKLSIWEAGEIFALFLTLPFVFQFHFPTLSSPYLHFLLLAPFVSSCFLCFLLLLCSHS